MGLETVSDPRHPSGFDPRLLAWFSPGFPVGAFAYSHGLEWAVERGWVRDRATLTEWLRDLLVHGAMRNDMILLAEASRATAERDARVRVPDPAAKLAMDVLASHHRPLAGHARPDVRRWILRAESHHAGYSAGRFDGSIHFAQPGRRRHGDPRELHYPDASGALCRRSCDVQRAGSR